jgi:phosphatidylethanolamine-binding protein (PEBP) family uncharacterized protein
MRKPHTQPHHTHPHKPTTTPTHPTTHARTPAHATTPPHATALALTLFTIALLTGCGNTTKPATTAAAASTTTPAGQPTTPANTQPPSTQPATTTPAQPAAVKHLPVVDEEIGLSSPVVREERFIPARYTCDGQDTPPPLRWRKVPPGTKELMLDILKIRAVNNQLYFAWAITGIKPTTHQIDPPHLPPGTITGTNTNGQTTYHLCQPKHTTETYVVALFALPHHLPAKPGFNALQLRNQAEHTAEYQSLFAYKYTRP